MRIYSLFAALALTGATAAAQTGQPLRCLTTSSPAQVRIEGVAERMGDLVLNCSGGAPGTLTGNIAFTLSVPVTNHLTGANSVDVLLTGDFGSGAVSLGVPAVLQSPNTVAFNGLNITVPAGGAFTLRISNLRGNVSNLPPNSTVTAFLSSSANIVLVNNAALTVGFVARGLLASTTGTTVYCGGSPLPFTVTFPLLLQARTQFWSTRFTEGFAVAFQPRGALEDNGTRFVVRYSNFPAGAIIYVPNFVAGSNATTPTAGGDLGVPASGGAWTPGTNSLLLVRILGTGANGAGGFPNAPTPTAAATFDAVSQVTLTGGAGIAVYEVVSADPSAVESAQFPAFLGYTPVNNEASIASQDMTLGPVSDSPAASASAIPRFIDSDPPSDCPTGNCDFFPRLSVNPGQVNLTAAAGAGNTIDYVRVTNDGDNILTWTTKLTYTTGSAWLRLDRTSGRGNATIRIDALPQNLQPGVYEAQLAIDAGPQAGSRTVPITFRVTPAVARPPAVSRIVNGASFAAGPVAPGAWVSLFGTNFAGKIVKVSFDNIDARVSFSNEEQINVMVPAALAGRTSAAVVVNIDNVSSASVPVTLAAIAPGIFGTLNQDYSPNSATSPARAGSVIQVYATGLPSTGRITARIHDRDIDTPNYAGPSGFDGMQQVNLLVPADMQAVTTDVIVCAEGAAGKVCSAPSRVTVF